MKRLLYMISDSVLLLVLLISTVVVFLNNNMADITGPSVLLTR
jgi:hypothetical protein